MTSVHQNCVWEILSADIAHLFYNRLVIRETAEAHDSLSVVFLLATFGLLQNVFFAKDSTRNYEIFRVFIAIFD